MKCKLGSNDRALELMEMNEFKEILIHEGRPAKFYLGKKKDIKVVISKASQGNIDIHKDKEDLEVYGENYCCMGCGHNFKAVQCCMCGRVEYCHQCFIFHRKVALLRSKF